MPMGHHPVAVAVKLLTNSTNQLVFSYMAGDYEGDELPSVDHGPLNEGPWEKCIEMGKYVEK